MVKLNKLLAFDDVSAGHSPRINSATDLLYQTEIQYGTLNKVFDAAIGLAGASL